MVLAFRLRPLVELTVPPRGTGAAGATGGERRRAEDARGARSWARWVALGLLVAANAACSDEAPQPAQCGPPGPAFDVRVHVPEPRLPADLTVTALYGAGEETYRLSAAMQRSEVLFCSPQAQHSDRPDGGGAGAPGQARGGSSGSAGEDPGDELLRCELWTDSSVTFRVSSARYLPIERELEPTMDRCGVATTDVALALAWPPE